MNDPAQNATIEEARAAAKDILSSALNSLRDTAQSQEGERRRLFFPDGIGLVSISIKVSEVKVSLEVKEAKGTPKEAVRSVEEGS